MQLGVIAYIDDVADNGGCFRGLQNTNADDLENIVAASCHNTDGVEYRQQHPNTNSNKRNNYCGWINYL